MEKSAAGLEMQKNIILNSLRESLASAWKNKMLFIFLFLLQLIFFSVFSVVNYYYQSKIIQSSNEIFDYLSRQKLDELSVADNLLQQKNIMGEDYMLISRNFNDITRNFRVYMAYVFVLLVIFSSVSWTLTNQFFGSINIKKLSRILSRNFIVLLFYLGIIFLFFFSLLNVSIMQLTADTSKLFTKYIVFLGASIILAYFMFISLSLANRAELRNIAQKTLIIGIKKAHYVLPAYVINILLFAVPAFLSYRFIESPFILFSSLILIVFSFVFGRMLMVRVIDKLEN